MTSSQTSPNRLSPRRGSSNSGDILGGVAHLGSDNTPRLLGRLLGQVRPKHRFARGFARVATLGGLGLSLAFTAAPAPAQGAPALPGLSALPAQALLAQASSRRDDSLIDPTEEVSVIADELDRFSRRFDTIQSDYAGGTSRSLSINAKKRYDEAVYSYLIEDYGRAALLFYTLLDRTDRQSFGEYPEAEWYLAESLFLNENYHTALEYFTRIVQFGGAHPFYQQAVVRMVETYGRTGNVAKFEAYYQRYMSAAGGGIPSNDRIDYALAKVLFLRGGYDRALPIFRQLAEGQGAQAPLAEYFIAATHVVRGELDSAVSVFETLLTRSINTPEQREVEDLAYLGLGRIYLERGDFQAAIESYQNISRYSPHFSDALYEMSSTYYRMDNVEKALQNIDILLLTNPDSVDAPELKLKRGLLLQEMEEYDSALDTYERLINEYTDIKEELDTLMSDKRDMLRYFNELVGTDLTRIESTLMVPAQAVRFAADDPAMDRALEVTRVLREEEDDLLEAAGLIRDIENVLNVPNPRDVVLEVKRVRGELRQLRDALLIAGERLVSAELIYIKKHIPASQARRLDSVDVLEEQMPELARQLPELERDRTELIQVYEAQVDEVERNVYKLERMVDDLIAQAASVEKYLSYTREDSGIDPDTEQSTRLRLGQEREELEAALSEIGGLLRQLKSMRLQEEIEGQAISAEEIFRRESAARVDRMKSALVPLRSSISRQDSAAFFEEVDASYAQVRSMTKQVEAFFKTLDAVEAQEIARIRSELVEEKARLSEYAGLVETYDAQAKDISEQIAYASFSGIQRYFSDLILNANVGIIDVFWEQKESKTEEMEQLSIDRSDGTDLLQEKFSALQANQ